MQSQLRERTRIQNHMSRILTRMEIYHLGSQIWDRNMSLCLLHLNLGIDLRLNIWFRIRTGFQTRTDFVYILQYIQKEPTVWFSKKGSISTPPQKKNKKKGIGLLKTIHIMIQFWFSNINKICNNISLIISNLPDNMLSQHMLIGLILEFLKYIMIYTFKVHRVRGQSRTPRIF